MEQKGGISLHPLKAHFRVVLALASLATFISYTLCERLKFLVKDDALRLVHGKKGGRRGKGFLRTRVKIGEPIELLSFWARRELTYQGYQGGILLLGRESWREAKRSRDAEKI